MTTNTPNNNPNNTTNHGITNTSTPTTSTRHATNSNGMISEVISSGTTVKLRIRINPGTVNYTIVLYMM